MPQNDGMTAQHTTAQSSGKWKLVAHKPHPFKNAMVEEVLGHYDSKQEAKIAKGRRNSPARSVRFGVEPA